MKIMLKMRSDATKKKVKLKSSKLHKHIFCIASITEPDPRGGKEGGRDKEEEGGMKEGRRGEGRGEGK